MLRRVGNAAATAGIAVLAPDSRGSTWDAIRGGFDRDVEFVNGALERVFQTLDVDPARLAVGGFSDGASYAVSLGLINGDLFRRVAAFSPGFIIERAAHGKPQVFISLHGDGHHHARLLLILAGILLQQRRIERDRAALSRNRVRRAKGKLLRWAGKDTERGKKRGRRKLEPRAGSRESGVDVIRPRPS